MSAATPADSVRPVQASAEGLTSPSTPAPLRWMWLILVLPVAHYLAYPPRVPGLSQPAAVRISSVVTLLAVLTIAAANWRVVSPVVRWAGTIAVLGALTNTLPRLTFGAMPYWVPAAHVAQSSPGAALPANPGAVAWMSPHGAWFTVIDFIPVPLPGVRSILSIGDLLLFGGLLVLLGHQIHVTLRSDAATPTQGPLGPARNSQVRTSQSHLGGHLPRRKGGKP